MYLPVVSKPVFEGIKVELGRLLHTQSITVPFFLPLLPLSTSFQSIALTPKASKSEWVMLIYIHTRKSYMIKSSGRILQNWNYKVLETADAEQVWRGTVLLGEKIGQDVFVADCAASCGFLIQQQEYADRFAEAKRLKQYVPSLQYITDSDFPETESRVWKRG